MTVATVIIWSVMSAVGVRSWKATESASRISDAYSSTSNRSTFFGWVMAAWLFLRELEAHVTVAVGIVTPVFAHLDEQEQVHRSTHDVSDLLARIRADRLDGRPALAEHDLALAFALDKDGLLDANGMILALGPAVGFDGGLVGQLLVQPLIDL